MQDNARPFPRGIEALLALWVGTLPVDRMDLLGGGADFILTPFLALTPVVLLILGYRAVAARRTLGFPENTRAFTLLLLTFVSLLLLSGLLGMDPAMSLRRSLRFLAVSGGAYLVALFLLAEKRTEPVLAQGAKVGLALMFLLGLWGVWALFSPEAALLRVGSVTLSLEPSMYGGIIPRFTGSVLDPNRTGFANLFFIFSLARFGRPGSRRQLWMGAGALMAVLTLSRSTVMAGAVMVAAMWILRGSLRVSRGQLVTACLTVALGAGLLLALPGVRASVAEGLEPVGGRFSLEERSTQDHFYLMRRGVEEGTASVRRASLGIGFGNAHLVLQDMFPGNKYGNFHSAFATLLAESGVFALLLFLILLGYPLVRPGPFTPFVAALAAFNIFYQTVNGPILWLVLSLAWMAGESSVRRPRDPEEAPPPAQQP